MIDERRSVRSKPISFSGWRECVKNSWLRNATENAHRLTDEGSDLWKVRKKRLRKLGKFLEGCHKFNYKTL